VSPASRFGHGLENGLPLAELRAIEPGTHHLGAITAPATGDVGEIDPAIIEAVRVQGNAQETALPFRFDRWQTLDWRWKQVAALDVTQAAGALSHPDISVGKKDHAPGVLQRLGDYLDVKTVLLGLTRFCM